eukprot:TRINITY_DN8148_c0_g1_i1.p1 TRINITY_DN8148_c0_g1~~TRINITY_DN8148_c0_g1_i1.p1  ORF type:complete len:415 (-),score=89.94 TRINITY_DN8148_c0_g1_i1:36-1280(-)
MDCLPKEQFVSHEYLNQLTCSIGLGIFNEPMELPCQHTFCKSCIKGWLKKDSSCPKCRNTVSKDSLKVHRVFASMIDNSVIACNNEGCKWAGPFATLQLHIMTECPEQLCYCPFGCTAQSKRSAIEEHVKSCELRITECRHCHARGQFKEIAAHEGNCQLGEIACPNECGMSVASSQLETHLSEQCKKRKMVCKFKKFIDCGFVGDSEESLALHYTADRVLHLEKLAGKVNELQEKVDEMYGGGRTTPEITPKTSEISNNSFIDVKWSNSSKIVSGTVSNYWSFFLSMTSIAKPFKTRIKIASVNEADTNGWKICLGVFNTAEFTVGSWGKYRNGWGYVLGNGNKMYTNASGYGKSFGLGDIISIVWNGMNLTFCKNEVSQGVAFTDIEGPLYLAVALSDKGHSVELLDTQVYN